MGDILNNLTVDEIKAIREKALDRRESRHCLWCDKEVSMRRDQKFCCANCRASYSQASAQVAFERIISEKAAWLKERDELLHEISTLRRQLQSLAAVSVRPPS